MKLLEMLKTATENHASKFSEAVARWCSVMKGVLKYSTKFTGKHLCQSLFFSKNEASASSFIKNKTQ